MKPRLPSSSLVAALTAAFCVATSAPAQATAMFPADASGELFITEIIGPDPTVDLEIDANALVFGFGVTNDGPGTSSATGAADVIGDTIVQVAAVDGTAEPSTFPGSFAGAFWWTDGSLSIENSSSEVTTSSPSTSKPPMVRGVEPEARMIETLIRLVA